MRLINCCSRKIGLILIGLGVLTSTFAQTRSIAHEWNEVLLESIRNDFARPTVHARNLFHASIIMYDSWAFFQEGSPTYFLGKDINGFVTEMPDFSVPDNEKAAIHEVMSLAMFRFLEYRFRNAPEFFNLSQLYQQRMIALGYDFRFESSDFTDGTYASLGNYLGNQMIEYGKQDGANEENDFENNFYQSVNEALDPSLPGNPNLENPSRWQPLDLPVFIDQSGNEISTSIDFLSPEWGFVETLCFITDGPDHRKPRSGLLDFS